MVHALLTGILNLLLALAKFLGSIFFYPLQMIIVGLFPSIDSQDVLYVTDFFSSEVFPFMAWLKGLFLNITGFPSALFSILVLQLLAFFAAAVAVRAIMFIVRLYYLIRGSGI